MPGTINCSNNASDGDGIIISNNADAPNTKTISVASTIPKLSGRHRKFTDMTGDSTMQTKCVLGTKDQVDLSGMLMLYLTNIFQMIVFVL